MNQNQNESFEIQAEEILENASEEEKKSLTSNQIMSFNEKKLLILFTGLFFIEGVPIGLLSGITLLLIQNGATLSQLSVLSICHLPYSFKFFFAPIADKIFYEPLGKRKTYILLAQYSTSFCFLLLGFIQISEIIMFSEVSYVVIIGIFLMLFSALQNVSLVIQCLLMFLLKKNGLILSSLSKKYVHMGSSCQQIGMTFGGIYGGVIMINLTSVRFRNLLFSKNEDLALISLEQFCIFTGILIFLITLYTHCYIQEEQEQMDKNSKSYSQIFKVCNDIWKVSQNRNTKILILYLLLRNVGVGPMTVSTSVKLIRLGFPPEVFSSFQLILFPLKTLMACFVGRFLKKGHEIRFIVFGYAAVILHSIMQYILVSFLGYLGGYNAQTLSIAIGIQSFEDIYHTFITCSVGGFFMRISNEKKGSSFLIFLTCVGNFGNTFSQGLSMILLKYVNFNVLVLCGWIFAITFIVIMKKLLEEVQQAKLDAWEPQLSIDEEYQKDMTSSVQKKLQQ